MDNVKLKKEVLEDYLSGKSYRDIEKERGLSFGFLSKILKGKRSLKDANRLARKQGKGSLTNEGRKKLSDAGIIACRKNKKFWTKPERMLFEIFNELGLSVSIPDIICEVFGVIGDKNGAIFCQYPVLGWTCDFAYVNKKIAFNVNGDYWHANPLLYDSDYLTYGQKKNIRQDSNKEKYLLRNGWKSVDLWESEIYWNKPLVISKIKQAIGEEVSCHVHTVESGVQFPDCLPDKEWNRRISELWFRSEGDSGLIKATEHRVRKPRRLFDVKCEICDKTIKVIESRRYRQKYCSPICASFARRRSKRPSKEQLESEINSMTWLAIGKKYGVSDNAVRKWARSFGIDKKMNCNEIICHNRRKS